MKCMGYLNQKMFSRFETDYQAFQNENLNLLNDIEKHFANLSDIDTLLRLETEPTCSFEFNRKHNLGVKNE